MNFQLENTSNNSSRLKRPALLLLLCLFASLFAVPDASAQSTCSGYALSGDPGQLVQLLNCVEDSSNSNADTSANLTAPAGIVAGDLLLVNLVTDSNGAAIQDPAGWTPIAGLVGARGISSQVWFRIADGLESGQNFAFTWTNGGERNYAYMLHFRGASGAYNFVSTTQGNNTTPDSQSVTPNSPDNLILRATNFDDDDITALPATIVTGHNNIIYNESGGGTGTVSLGAVYLHQIGGPVATGGASFTLQNGEGSHRRTISIEPIEFRFSMPGSGVSNVCGLQEITLNVTDKDGNLMQWFGGTVTLGTTGDNSGAIWSDAGSLTNAPVPVGDGTYTYTFAPGALNDGGTATFYYYNPVPDTYDFNVSYGSFSERANFTGPPGVSYTGPTLTVNDCEFRITYADGSMGTCQSEEITVTLVDALTGVAATEYSGTVTINNNEARGSYTGATNGAPGVASFNLSVSAIAATGSASAVLTYIDTTADLAVDFDFTENTARAMTDDDGNGTTDPDLLVSLCEFRLVYTGDTTADTCSVQEVTLQAFLNDGIVSGGTGALISDFVGAVTISNGDTVGHWDITDSANGPGTDTDPDDGEIEYTFVAGDGGDIVLDFSWETAIDDIDFQVVRNTPNGIASPSGTFDQLLDIVACTIRIDVAATMGTCTDGETITFTILDNEGGAADNFAGEIEISQSHTPPPAFLGDYVLTPGGLGGTNALGDVMADDGVVTYQFDLADAGQLQVDFSTTTEGAIQFTAAATPGTTAMLVDGFSARDLNVQACKIVFSHSEESDVCSLEAITISVTDPAGTPIDDFAGTITITNNKNKGSWSVSDVFAPGNIIDTSPNDGEIEYTFDPDDDGDIILFFELAEAAIGIDEVDFDATSTTAGIASPTGVDDETLEIVNCTARVTVAAQANVCSVSETVTVGIYDRGGLALAGGTIGNVTINANGDGDYISTDGVALNLLNGGPNDGVASYEFDGSEGGDATFEFSTNTVENLVFSASAPFIDFDAGNSAENLEMLDCEFRIFFDTNQIDDDSTSDVCLVQSMTISVFNENDAPVTDYVGTISLGASSGSWVENGGSLGDLDDNVPQNGSATYAFQADGNDLGSITLGFNTDSAGSYNFSVTEGSISADNADWDPDLVVGLCKFRITMVGDTPGDEVMSACEAQDITFQIVDSDGNDVVGYEGFMSLATTSLNGAWSGTRVTEDAGPDNGIATYEFDGTETDSTATITFTNTNPGTLNVIPVSGEIVKDGAFDPELEVTGCLPSVVSSICFSGDEAGTGLGSINLADTPGQGRMVVMWIFWAFDGTGDRDGRTVTSATLGGVAMEEVGQIGPGTAGILTGFPNLVTGVAMFAIDDDNMIAGAINPTIDQAGAYTFSTPFNPGDEPSMCLAEFENVEQNVLPATGSPGSTGQVNTTAFDGSLNGSYTTSITTTANNALVLSGVSSDLDRTGGAASWLNGVNPNPPMEMLFTGSNDQNPEYGTAGGSSGTKAVAGLISVEDEDNNVTISSASHIVASFNPLVAGPPQAEDFVPVLLYETLSGNSSYRAIGHTLRDRSNSSTVPNTNGECSFVDETVGTSAVLDMPPGSTVMRAYLYWAASGVTPDLDIEFGEQGGTIHELTGVEAFQAITGGLDYYASYRDVTTEVTAVGNGTYTFRELDTSAGAGAPWGPGATACAGGWSLVVIYSNPLEEFRVTNVFHGFQPFQDSSFTLVPRNFRMQTTDNSLTGFLPNGQITHITVEGDETIEGGAGGGEALAIQDGPIDATFTALTNPYNPITGDFNSTVTRPTFVLDGPTNKYQWTGDLLDGRGGYETDSLPQYDPYDGAYNPDNGETRQAGDSWGFDIDTHYLAGNVEFTGTPPNEVYTELWPFAQPGSEAEAITTQYSSGQDLVLLVAEIISVTNFDLADLEIFKEAAGDFKVEETQDYTIRVTNNGNNGVSGGEATGVVVVADILPNGMTVDTLTAAPEWDCVIGGGADRFTCTYDIATDCLVTSNEGTVMDPVIVGCATPNQLSTDESLPTITVTVLVGGSGAFPNEVNPVKNSVRLQHNGLDSASVDFIDTNCQALITGNPGEIPDPALCRRAPQFDNLNDLDGGLIDINDLDDKVVDNNNNVDSVVANVIGKRTDLAIDKTVNGDLEVNETQTYTITVGNNGPDDADQSIKILDSAPAGITFAGASGTGWNCTVNTASDIDCDYAAGLIALDTTNPLTLTVNVVGVAGQPVKNTAQVISGTFNFDTIDTDNNTDDADSVIIAPAVESQEEFLISVSRLVVGDTTIGKITDSVTFSDDDYINYNPLTDVGKGFFDNIDTGNDVNDANAVHVFKNGHIAISAAAQSTVGSGGGQLTFEPEDIVVYDPILDSAVSIFDGSAIFDGPITASQSIDAVYVKDDGKGDAPIVFSVVGDGAPGDDACISWPGPNQLCFERGDIVQYNPVDGSASILVDASEIFDSDVQVNGIYLRVEDDEMQMDVYNGTKDIFILTIDGTEQVGACAGCDPTLGTTVTRDDIVEVDLTGADAVTQNLFVGDLSFGEFDPVDDDRAIDALHVKEDRYHGHFSISQSELGSTCEAGQITIRKHEYDHSKDSDYVGTIYISTDDGIDETGRWSVADGTNSVVYKDLGGGVMVAQYTFDELDNGEVTLFLSQATPVTLNVDVTNLIVGEQEDPSFVISNLITNISYRDEFTAAAFDNQDGSASWAEDWVEVDGLGGGAASGDVTVSAGSMQFTNTAGGTATSMSRVVSLAPFPIADDLVQLSFDFKYSNLNGGGSDEFIVEARDSAGDSFEEVWSWTTGGSNAVFQSSGSIELSTDIPSFSAWTETAEIRFRVLSGYGATQRMFIDNVLLQTSTSACGANQMNHYEIQIDMQTGTRGGQIVDGISCLASEITISGHDAGHLPAEPDEMITLNGVSETTAKGGFWNVPHVGSGTFFESGTNTDGIATYDFTGTTETQVKLNFNYPNPTLSPELVHFEITSAFGVDANEDPSLRIRDIALQFFNETLGLGNNLPTQISGKPSTVAAPDNDVLTLRVLTVDTSDTTQCIPLIDAGEEHTFSFILECVDPGSCYLGGGFNGDVVTINNEPIGRVGVSGYADVDLTFATFPNAGVAVEVPFMYQDAGEVQINARFDVPSNISDDTDPGDVDTEIGAAVGAPLESSSNVFTVRPFGLDVDFSGGRADTDPGQGGQDDESWADDADGSAFAVAGIGFDTTVRGIQYDAADDTDDNNGIPDDNAELWNNKLTPNFANDTTAGGYKVVVNSTTVAPPGGFGDLTNNEFLGASFGGAGSQSHSMTFDEVGIIDLEAELINTSDDMAATYLSSGVQLTGHARQVGRFYPAYLRASGISRSSVVSRYQAVMDMPNMCIVDPNTLAGADLIDKFTYMGEEFGLSFDIEAMNNGDVRTQNYVDGFAKLTIDETDFSFYQPIMSAIDTNYTTQRLQAGALGPAVVWPANNETPRGLGSVSGNLIFNRLTTGEDGPYTEVNIGIDGSDGDAFIAVDTDIDNDMTDDLKLITVENFRYGRLMIDNAFGPETEELGIPFRIEYWNGSDWELNAADSCTALSYDGSEAAAASRSLSYVDGSWEGPLDGNGNNMDDGETVIESAAVLAVSDVTVSISGGRTGEDSGVDTDADDQDDDRPFRTSAPGEGFEGSVLVEFDLSNGARSSLDFLSYDWRTPGDVFEDAEDLNYDDNPRGQINFGSYRGHDRVINWQEIYIGPTPPP